MVARLCTTLTILFLCYSSIVNAAVIGRVDRSSIAINESLTLTFEVDNKQRYAPDFSAIEKDFDIISQNQSSNHMIINGNASYKTVYKLTLIAKRLGQLTIPEIKFGKNRSANISIDVKQAAKSTGSDNVEFDVHVNTRKPYLQQQVLITVKLYLAVNISQASLSEPEFSHQNIILKRFDEDKRYESMHNGRRYSVIERQYVVFPQASGNLTLKPLHFDAMLLGRQQRSRLFGNYPPSNGKQVRISSKAITLDVQAKPDNMTGKHWLPASQVSIRDQWSQDLDNIRVGESITRTIRIQARQQLSSTIPVLTTPTIQHIKIYPDQPSQNEQAGQHGINSESINKYALVPTQAGEVSIPAVQLHWWNTKTNQAETAELPARTIQVKPAAIVNTPISQSVQPLQANQQALALPQATDHHVSNYWRWLALLAFTGWGLTLFIWWKLAYSRRPVKLQARQQTKALAKQVVAACNNHQPQQTQRALLDWAAAVWPEQKPTSLGILANKASGQDLQQQIELLQTALYKPVDNRWNGSELRNAFQCFKPVVPPSQIEKNKHPLFKIA